MTQRQLPQLQLPQPFEVTDVSSSSLEENLPRQQKRKLQQSTLAATTMPSSYEHPSSSEAPFVALTSSSSDGDEAADRPEPDGPAQHTHATNPHQTNHQTDHQHQTTVWQTFVHLVKGYIGPGCLSLPWAMSQLGIIPGVLLCFGLAAWTSYNCWIVVGLKRQLMAQSRPPPHQPQPQLTYPDVAGCLYGPGAQRITSLSICTQQLAICTVFFSFCGDNLQAVLNAVIHTHIDADHAGFSHTAVISFCLPLVLLLSMIPDLKALTPAVTVGTILLMAGFGILALLVGQEWTDRPPTDASTGFPYWNTGAVPFYPLAVCALLYSYEGVCLILPIESAMAQPEHFGATFCAAMFLAATTYSTVAALAVYVFGQIQDGSLTAFLLDRYETRDPPPPQELIWLLWIANAVVSLSVLLTFPLQLLPALELVQKSWDSNATTRRPGFAPIQTSDEDASVADEAHHEGLYGNQVNEDHIKETVASTNALSSVFTIGDDDDDEDVNDAEQGTAAHAEAATLTLSNSHDDEEEAFSDEPEAEPIDGNQDSLSASLSARHSFWLRIILVLFTYLVAIVIPNVQSLIALAGALAGSLTALIVPPALAMANGRQLRGGQRAMCGVSLALGIVFGSVGTGFSLREIWETYASGDDPGDL
jgi:proton-coupled amino acid transporter